MSTLVLTSDFPSTVNPLVAHLIKSSARAPRIAWIPPETAMGRRKFPAARSAFQQCGCDRLELIDIDQAPDPAQLDALEQFDVIYLSGGDPIAFRQNIQRSVLSTRLRWCLAAGRVVIGASGGALQFTPNVSLFRLTNVGLDEVLAERSAFDGLGLVSYELLPHLNRVEATFLDTVRRYSEHLTHDVMALADSSAIVHVDGHEPQISGRAARFCRGVMTWIDGA